MTTLRIHQAVYGYSDGHRLLASSLPITGTAGRLLRAVTDMAFDGESDSYLTVLPVADLKAQAFIRSWPGPNALRAGSVWSQVLLVDFVDLGQVRQLPDLLALFAPPNDDAVDWASPHTFVAPAELRLRPSRAPSSWKLNGGLTRELVGAFYSTTESISLAASIKESERVLLAMFEQQWPRLRRTFSFRTRSRSSANPSYRFDIEVVEKERGAHPRAIENADWVDVLSGDLMKPNLAFRELLRTFGAESSHGRVDMAGLVSVISQAQQGVATPAVLDQLCARFPAPHSMRKLKTSLVGAASKTAPRVPNWPSDDLVRLALLFETSRPCLDLDDLDLKRRLHEAWRTRPSEVVSLVARAQTDDLTNDQLGILVSAAASEASPPQVAQLAAQSSDLGLLVARANPAIVEAADLWSVEEFRPALLDILASQGRKAQTQTLVALIDADANDSAANVCSLDGSLWWDAFMLLGTGADSKDRFEALSQRAQGLRRVLEIVGPAAVGEPHRPPTGQNELVLLAFCANPSAGLWRHAPTEAWVELVEALPTSSHSDKHAPVMFRISALALTAATQSGSNDLRRRAWLASFGVLHRGLESVREDDEAWFVLQSLLPREPAWDRCDRLRKAAVETVIRDRWSAADVDKLLTAVPDYGADLAQALRAREERKKKSRGWLLDFIDDLLR